MNDIQSVSVNWMTPLEQIELRRSGLAFGKPGRESVLMDGHYGDGNRMVLDPKTKQPAFFLLSNTKPESEENDWLEELSNPYSLATETGASDDPADFH